MSTHFKIVELEQGTQRWLDWRDSVVGSSDAPSIMGENPYRSYDQLLGEKLGTAPPKPFNAKMKEGVKREPEARYRYEQLRNVSVTPLVLQSLEYEWQVASVDGICLDTGVVVEIKVGQKAYDITSSSRRPPKYYVGQLQHILAVTGYEEIDFFAFWPGKPDILLTIERDDYYIRRLIDKEFAFLQKMNPRKAYSKRQEPNPNDVLESEDGILFLGERYDDTIDVATGYGVSVETVEAKWIHWLHMKSGVARDEVIQEIKARKLNFEHGHIGTEEEEEQREEEEAEERRQQRQRKREEKEAERITRRALLHNGAGFRADRERLKKEQRRIQELTERERVNATTARVRQDMGERIRAQRAAAATTQSQSPYANASTQWGDDVYERYLLGCLQNSVQNESQRLVNVEAPAGQSGEDLGAPKAVEEDHLSSLQNVPVEDQAAEIRRDRARATRREQSRARLYALAGGGGFVRPLFKKPKYSGKCTLTLPDGRTYDGELNNREFEEQNTQSLPDSREYVSDFKGNAHSGQGAITFSEGDTYVGEFRDGKFDGQGTYTWPGGEKYIGEWRDGERDGWGDYMFADDANSSLRCEWSDGIRVHQFGDGGKYVGETRGGNPNGHGTLTSPDGWRRYVGEFKDGRYHGQGTYTYADGAPEYVGEFEDGRSHGQGTLKYPDGRQYVGEFRDNNPNGQGTLKYPFGRQYVGEFRDGQPTGKGKWEGDQVQVTPAFLHTKQRASERVNLNIELNDYLVAVSAIQCTEVPLGKDVGDDRFEVEVLLAGMEVRAVWDDKSKLIVTVLGVVE